MIQEIWYCSLRVGSEIVFHANSVNCVFQTDFIIKIILLCLIVLGYQSPWLRGLNRGTAAARLRGLRIRILPGKDVCLFFNFVCCQVEVTASS